jgi:hypothetical protein
MFKGPRESLYGKEQGTIKQPYTRWGGGPKVTTIADYTAMSGIGDIMSVVEMRSRAFSNVMDAYLVYITALCKTVVPVSMPHVAVSEVPEAPPLPKGFGWAVVSDDVAAARDVMKSAAQAIFGINSANHPERHADYIETIESWADVSLELRGAWEYFDGLHMVTTWTEGAGKTAQKRVAKTYVEPDSFMEEFIHAETKLRETQVAELRAFRYAEQDQRRRRLQTLKAEPRLSRRGRGEAAAPTEEQRRMFASTRSIWGETSPRDPEQTAPPEITAGSSDLSDLDELLGLTGERQARSAASSRSPEPVPVSAPAFASGEDSAYDDMAAIFGKLNNPRGPVRRGYSPKTRYNRGR